MDQFANYQIEKPVVSDEKYIIYQAKDQQQKTVFLKTLKAEFPDLKDVARLQRENNLINHLNVNEVIKTFGIIRDGHQVAMVMEAMENGVALHDYCRNNPLTIDEFLMIAIQIVHGLMVLHENKIIHKDLTPMNILYSKENKTVKIIDFGISTQARKEKAEIAGLNIPDSSLPYIAPEQTGWSNTDLDYRADFYSLGCTFYEMLTGKPPFSAEKKSDYFKQHISQTVEPVKNINPNVPDMISTIVSKLLEKSPENRYQSSYGLYKDLLKCQTLGSKADISWSFPLAEDDIADKFMLSNKVYGREKEISLLKQEMTGTIEKNKLGLVSVSGFSGIGKTSLVKELEQQIKINDGFFVSGKFEQYQRELPYHALSQAFNEILDRALQSEEREHWINEIKNTLSTNGRVLIDLVPKLKNILGDSPELQDLGTKESYNRFLATVNQFIQIFAKPAHPLVIFIDDLQWAPTASFNLINEIAEKNKDNALILILSYRSNEVDESHPLTSLLSTMEKITPISKIELTPLKKEDINMIVSEALHTYPKSCVDIAEIIFERSGGNPFFAEELLTNLYDQRYIEFNYENGAWQWDIEKIRALHTSDDVVEFMVARLLQLPPETISLLKKAACIGNRFSTKLLADIAQSSFAELSNNLIPALDAQVLLPIASGQILENTYDKNNLNTQIHTNVTYRFQHDRIQQAIYELTQEEEKPTIHFLIGSTMLNTLNPQEVDENVVLIANHMNKAKSFITDPDKKLKLAQINLKAGIKAISSIAYRTAYEFLKTGIELLSPQGWERQYQLTHDMFENFSQSAFLCGEYEDADKANDVLLKNAKTKLEKAKIYRLRGMQNAIDSESQAALNDYIEGLRLLGIKFKNTTTTLSVLNEFLRTKWAQGFKAIDSLIQLPLMNDPEKKVCMQLLVEMIAPCYILGNTNLFAKAILRQVSLSIRYGHTIEAPHSYASYGTLLNAVFNQPENGFKFGELAVKLNEKLGDISLRCRTLFVFYAFIFPWNRPMHELYDIYDDLSKLGYQSGDLLYMTYSIHLCLVLQPKNTIKNYILLGKKYLEMVKSAKYDDSINFVSAMLQFKLGLQDRENSEYFKINSEDENQFFAKIKAAQFASTVTVYLIKKLIDCYTFGDYGTAYDRLDEVEKSLAAMLGSVITEEFYVFATLVLSRQYLISNTADKKKILKRMQTYYKIVQNWASHCEINFLQHALLLEATILHLKGKNKKAEEIYEKALITAQKNNFLHDEALINEEISHFYKNLGNTQEEKRYTKQAHYSYLRWGALAKTKQLESQYSFLVENIENSL